ncbi:MAG TPA: histidine kinase [Trebonia sp.]|nr:histidine kinase [Trebonia sp.]
MPRLLNVLARSLGLTWVGILTFGVYPPPAGLALAIQVAGYLLSAAGMTGWALLDFFPRLQPYRARWLPVPLGVMAVATALASAVGYGGTAMVIFGFIAAMVASSDCDLSMGLAVTAAGILATDVTGLAYGGSYGTLLGLPSVLFAGFMIGRNRAAYRIRAEQTAALLLQREQFQAEQRRADLLDERARIAREIHDVLAHSLGALGIQIQAARSVLTDRGDIARAGELLAGAQRMASEGLVETRRAISALHADALPLEQELAQATTTARDRYGVAATMHTAGTPRPVPPDATLALLRVAQEALVNAAKHAPGQPVTAILEFGPDDIKLIVRNDLAPSSRDPGSAPLAPATPAPLAPATPAPLTTLTPPATQPLPATPAAAGVSTADTHYGLTSMRERLRLLNGILDAGPADGKWTVSAWLPLAPAGEPGRPVLA